MEKKKTGLIPAGLLAGSILLLIAAVVPLLIIAKYSHPCADDYSYGLPGRIAWVTTGSIIQVIKGAFESLKVGYITWQGTHTSIFLMSLSPAVFEGSLGYGVSTWILLGMLILSVTILLNTIFFKVLGTKKWQSLFVTFITLFWMIESVYSPVNGFFWFNGSVHYCFMHGCMLLMLANMLSFYCERRTKNRRGWKIAYIFFASFFGYMCGGANYSTALTGLCLLGLLLLVDCIALKYYLTIIPIVFYIGSFLASVLAPGNTVRGTNFDGMGPVEAIFESVKLAFLDDIKWTDLQTLIIFSLLIPVLFVMAKEVKIKLRFYVPIISLVVSFGIHAALNVPLFFAMGEGGLERQENICKFWFQMMLVINAFLIICVMKPLWEARIDSLCKRISEKKRVAGKIIPVAFYLLLIAILFVHVKTSDNTIRQYSSYIAYIELMNGEAKSYLSTYETRMDIIKNNTGDVVLPDYSDRPYILYFDDITDDKSDWRNSTFAKWYDLESVTK